MQRGNIGFLVRTAVIVVVLGPASLMAQQPGVPIKDQKLFSSLRERYNGQYEDHVSGDAAAETLKDGSILVELIDRVAEFSFYNIPRATEEFLYVPRQPTAGWLNFYDRSSDSIKCGEASYDLEKDIFPAFKCRFTVDRDGRVHFFMDRSSATSSAEPPVATGWEGESGDFHWRTISQIPGAAWAFSDVNVRRDSGGKVSFELDLSGAVAARVYVALNAAEGTTYWGPRHPMKIKHGTQIECLTAPTDAKDAKCRIAFGFEGLAEYPGGTK